jgi:cytochrome c-type biogenesis protein CcsB
MLAACAALLCRPAPARADDFLDRVDLSPLQSAACQSNQTLKTLDSMARQMLEFITNHASLDGRPSVVTLFDMSLRPDLYRDRPLIRITSVPLRKDFQQLDSIDTAEKDRIVREGTVSLNFWRRADVMQLHDQIMAADTRKASALQQVDEEAAALATLVRDRWDFPPLSLIPPGSDSPATAPWRALQDIVAAENDLITARASAPGGIPPGMAAPSEISLAGYDLKTLQPVLTEAYDLCDAWRKTDAATVNQKAAQLAADLPLVRPQLYPSSIKRQAEVVYNRLAKLTIPGAIMYLLAFVFFLMGLRSGLTWMRAWGLGLMSLALAIHAGGIAIRWWLVGDVFPPIKNEFESVMFSAFFGAVVGLILELRTRKFGGLFGAAASFVGMLALLALFAAPYVAGRDIGGEIAPVNGVLMSYWLYIHVTMVTASYALIAMGFVLSAWWLIKYAGQYGTLRPSAWRQPLAVPLSTSRGGAPASQPAYQSGSTAEQLAPPSPASAAAPPMLAALDQCNLVVLLLAFCMLLLGIVFGAIWADQSWGRPWGWDPKETFALVTWIVYLIVVHVRVVTVDKAWWTAVLGVLGFFVMLFNWIGVNFWLAGLHSYA